MKKCLILALVLISASIAKAEQVVLQTKNTTMVLNVEGNKQPQYVYSGTNLSEFDLSNLQLPRSGRMDAYPAYGMNCPAEAAIAITHADGNMSTELYADYVDEVEADAQGNREVRIRLIDPVYPVTVDLCYKAYFNEDIIETWTEILNGEKKNVVMIKATSTTSVRSPFASYCSK